MKVFFTWHAAVEPEYRKLFKEIAALGVELVVIAPESWHECGKLQTIKDSTADGYTLKAMPVVFRNRVKGFFYPGYASIAGLMKSFKPDIVHVFEEPYAASCFEFLRIARSHSPSSKVVIQSFENLNIPQGLPFSLIERFTFSKADAIVSIPLEGENVWREKGYKGRIFHAPVGLDENLFRKTDGVLDGCEFLEDRARLRVAYVGRLTPEKGISTLIESFASSHAENLKSELLIVGNGDAAPYMRLVENFSIKDRVKFIPALGSGRLPLLYSKIDVLVLPSVSTPGWKEQFGRVLIEAMACGAVAVGSSSGEIPNVIGDAGFVFREGDAGALADILKRLMQDRILLESMSSAGRARVLENYTWKQVAKRLIEIYDGLLLR